MAIALRPRLRPSSMNSRNGSQADGDLGFSGCVPLNPTPNPVVTCMAGFESWLLLFLLLGRFSGLMLQFSAASPGSDPVVTSLAAFAGTCRPHAPGARTAMPAALRYALPVSRRTPVACSIRRRDQPRRPNAITCCRFSSLKTLLMPTKATLPSVVSTSRDYFSLAGFEVAIIGRFWVATEDAVGCSLLARLLYGASTLTVSTASAFVLIYLQS